MARAIDVLEKGLCCRSVWFSLLLVFVMPAGCERATILTPNVVPGGERESHGHSPIAEFDQLNVDLGEVEITSIDTKATAKFKVKNAGDAPLTIHRMEVSCGCTRVSPPDGSIAPGASVEIEVSVTISRAGRESASVVVHSNSVASPKTTVRIVWNAIAPILVVPEEILAGDVPIGKVTTVKADLVLSRLQTCPLSNVTLDKAARLDCNVSIELDDTGSLHVEVRAGSTPGEYVEYAVLKLTNCWRDSIRVPIRWRVITKHSMTPDSIYVGQVAPAHPLKKVVMIAGPENAPLKGVRVRNANPSDVVIGSVWKAVSSNSGILTIEMNAPSAVGAFHTEVRVQVSDDENEDLTTTVSGYVLDAGL